MHPPERRSSLLGAFKYTFIGDLLRCIYALANTIELSVWRDRQSHCTVLQPLSILSKYTLVLNETDSGLNINRNVSKHFKCIEFHWLLFLYKCIQKIPKTVFRSLLNFITIEINKCCFQEGGVPSAPDQAGISAITCYLHACRHQNEAKSRKYLAKVIWLLSYDDEQCTLADTVDKVTGVEYHTV